MYLITLYNYEFMSCVQTWVRFARPNVDMMFCILVCLFVCMLLFTCLFGCIFFNCYILIINNTILTIAVCKHNHSKIPPGFPLLYIAMETCIVSVNWIYCTIISFPGILSPTVEGVYTLLLLSPLYLVLIIIQLLFVFILH